MTLEEKTKEEVQELIRNNDRVLAYEEMDPEIGGKFTEDGRKEIRLLEIDGVLTGMIFSPEVMRFDLSNFDGKFTIRTDLLV